MCETVAHLSPSLGYGKDVCDCVFLGVSSGESRCECCLTTQIKYSVRNVTSGIGEQLRSQTSRAQIALLNLQVLHFWVFLRLYIMTQKSSVGTVRYEGGGYCRHKLGAKRSAI